MTDIALPETERDAVALAARRGPFPWLLAGLGVALLLVTLAGWTAPLALWRTPTNLPAGAPLVLIFGQDRAGALAFALPAFVLTVLWVAAVVLAARMRGREAVIVAAAVAVLLTLALLPINPGGTQDIYHNIADARLLWLHHVNPTLIPPLAYPDDPFFRHVWGYADLPSAYGPLWYELAGLPLLVSGDTLVPNLLAQKALVAAFLLGTVALTALAVQRLAPERTVVALVLTGWSPLLAFEAAGNGHNDSVMAFFLAAALLAAARRGYLWVLPLLALSVLVKFTTALIVPVALIWLLRRPDLSRRRIAAGALIAILGSLAVYAPLYAGRDTVAALQRPGMTFILSPGTLLHGSLAGAVADDQASRLVRLGSGAVFALCYAVTLWRTRGDARELAARAFDALFAYLVLASWWFWPWYITWLAPAAALSRGWHRAGAFAAFCGGALFTYLYWWAEPGWRTAEWFRLYGAITFGVFIVPAVLSLAGRRLRRVKKDASRLTAGTRG